MGVKLGVILRKERTLKALNYKVLKRVFGNSESIKRMMDYNTYSHTHMRARTHARWIHKCVADNRMWNTS